MTALESFDYDVEEALENIKVPSYILDDTGIIRWVNSAAIELVGDVHVCRGTGREEPGSG